MEARSVKLYPASVKTVKGTKWGYINKNGEFEVRPIFDYAMEFQENGLAVVEKNNLYGIINDAKKYVLKPKYYSITDFSQGRAIVNDEKGYGVINEKGKRLTTKPYQFMGMYHDNRALFAITVDNNYLYGYVNLEGKEAIPAQYKSAGDFENNQSVVETKEGKYILINPEGEVIATFPYPYVTDLGEGLFSFREKNQYDQKFGIMDVNGKVIIPPRYTGIQPFQDQRAVVNVSEDYRNKYGLIDLKGNYVIQPTFNDINLLGEKRVSVGKAINIDEPYRGSIYRIADTNGNMLTDFKYTRVLPYENGFASASDGKLTFFINKNGEIAQGLPNLKGSGTLSFEGELIKADIDQRTSYYTKDGKLVWKQNTVIPLNRQYKLLEKKFKPREDFVVYYPQIEGMMNKTAELQVNRKLKDISLEPTNTNLTDFTYSADFNIEFFKKDLLVIEMTGYLFPIGAAHGMPSQTYPHINVKNGTFYELKDLFKPDSDYVKVLSGIIDEQIKEDETYSYVFPDANKGIRPDQPFYVSENDLYIYFEPYEIAPYAAGFPTFKIHYEEIFDIINKKGEFWRSYH